MASLLSWSDLPIELLTMIKNRLNEYPSDVCRFRSVCSSWRSSTPPVKNSLPFPHVLLDNITQTSSHIKQVTIYCFEHLSQSSSFPTPWFVAVELADGKHRYLNPLTSLGSDPCTLKFSKELNLCDFKITELHRVYSVEINDDTKKALFISNSYYDETLLAICDKNVAFYRLENSQWVELNKVQINMPNTSDIVLYQGKVWSVGLDGRTFVYTSSLDAIEVPSCFLVDDMYSEFYFIESFGDLFVVQFKQRIEHWTGSYELCGKDELSPRKIQKFDVGENRFVEVRHLDDGLFVIAQEFPWSFSVPSLHIPDGMGNCIVSSAICYDEYDSDDDEDYNAYYFILQNPTKSMVWEIEKAKHGCVSFYEGFDKLFFPSSNWFVTENP